MNDEQVLAAVTSNDPLTAFRQLYAHNILISPAALRHVIAGKDTTLDIAKVYLRTAHGERPSISLSGIRKFNADIRRAIAASRSPDINFLVTMALAARNYEDDVCCICHDKLSNNAAYLIVPCGHAMCQHGHDEIDHSIALRTRSCPICRQTIDRVMTPWGVYFADCPHALAELLA